MLFSCFLTMPNTNTLVFLIEHQLDVKYLLMRGTFFTEHLVCRDAAKDAQGLGLEYPLVIPVWHGTSALFDGSEEAAPKHLLGLQESSIKVYGCNHSFQGSGQQGALVAPTMLVLTTTEQ